MGRPCAIDPEHRDVGQRDPPPAPCAGRSVPSASVTTTRSASATTCWLVMMTPFGANDEPGAVALDHVASARATKNKSQGERARRSRRDGALMETTAAETRSAAATSAVRREASIAGLARRSRLRRLDRCGLRARGARRWTGGGLDRRPRCSARTSADRATRARARPHAASSGSSAYSSAGIGGAPRSRGPAAVPAGWSRWLSAALQQAPRCRRAGRRPSPDVHHGAHQHAHHVMEEAVGLDVEAQP